MARQRKPDGERLVPLTAWVSPSRYDELHRQAKAREMPLSELARRYLDPSARFPTGESAPVQSRPH